jgi:exopolysaccharide biosynthesis polyprenyl glycosylphosphotransferase
MEYLGPLQYLDTLVEKEQIDELIATDPKIKKDTLEALLEYSYMYHLRFRFVPDAFEVQRTNVAITEESGIPVIEMKPSPLDGWGRVMKRMVDILGALVGGILLSPILILTALSIKIDSRGPVIFAQKRYGKNGKLFTFYKFRSMRVGAEKEHEKLMEQSERGGLLKMKQDPRVTRLGRVLRKTSIDELPQLWNVLKGDMSLVGPRPHMPSEVDKMTKKYHMVLHMKPGITGLAATSGRSSIDFDAEMRLDLYYMENWSLLLDTAIILKTIKVCLVGKDAS